MGAVIDIFYELLWELAEMRNRRKMLTIGGIVFQSAKKNRRLN